MRGIPQRLRSGAPWPAAWLLLLWMGACAPAAGRLIPHPPAGAKVVVVGIGGVTWEEIAAADTPTLDRLVAGGAAANVTVRVTNRAAEGYAMLGAGRRASVDPSGGWAFSRDEAVERGPASALFRRRTGGTRDGEVLVPTIAEIRQSNEGRGFDARLGSLGDALAARGRVTAVVGNADVSRGPLPQVLPTAKQMLARVPPDPGIHRGAALAVMRSDGTVPVGDVSRGLLEDDPDAPYGVATSRPALAEAFRRAAAAADLVVVETGDTARADAYALGLVEERARAIRLDGLQRADRLIAEVLAAIDTSRTLLVVVAPTTPGGPNERGQLRPGVVYGAGVTPGVLVSGSTRREGLVTIQDLTATIARHLGAANDQFASGRPVRAVEGRADLRSLMETNERARTHDAVRGPLSFTAVGLELAVFAVAAIALRKGRMPAWVAVLLLAALASPASSYLTKAFWRAGPMATGTLAIVSTLAAGAGAWLVMRAGVGPAQALLAGSGLFFLLDLATGATVQLDSLFGYTSVAGDRFFGLGNLGFAMFAASALLLAGGLADLGRAWRWVAVALAAVVALWVGHPRLGADVGGFLTMLPATAVLAVGATGRGRIQTRRLLLILVGAGLAVSLLGIFDLARPPAERTHLGTFLADTLDDPGSALPVVRRKTGASLRLVISTRWGLVIPGAVAVLVWLHRRSDAWKGLLARQPGMRAGFRAVIVAAVVGSLVNDSGAAVAGMMLAVGVPWVLLVAGGAEPLPSPGSSRRQGEREVPTPAGGGHAEVAGPTAAGEPPP